MKLITFALESDRAPRVGARLADGAHILDFGAALGLSAGHDLLAWFDLDGPWFARARALYEERAAGAKSLDDTGAVLRRDRARLLAPVPRPGKLICIGLNYRDHAAESNMPIPERPVVFSKFATSVATPDQPVVIPATSAQVDYEAELAVVIGRRAKGVPRDRALDYVLGYTNFNDVSARDFQFADGQWQRGKSCDTFAPMGPYIATTDEIPDPHRLSIRLRLNGQTMQDSNTDQLIFGVPELVSFLSETITLEPGDVIATGTPPGVGFARKPPVFLKPGDVMEVEIAGLGVLSSPLIAEER
ncbi:MAG TPA: fumarylacetoacetate hydrolase family protein [Blastocatellia bacterium]|nr:fumarylacetoacetate hydrolase family protein [Blastocatellia bacterium]